MDVQVTKYAHQNHQDYCEITLCNNNGMQVKILNYGATLEKILLPRNGKLENVILSLDSPADYSKKRNFLGGTVGRIVGRVRLGQWQVGQHILQLPLNDGHNHAHGGQGTDTRVFRFRPHLTPDYAQVCLTLFDPDGRNGYPGNLKITVTYTLDNQNQLAYEVQAYTDKVTIFNPTNHVYFRLDGDQTTIKDLNLQINSNDYLPLDTESLPSIGRKSVRNTPFDFRKGQRLGDVLNTDNAEIKAEHGLNHPFILNGKVPAATLTSPTKHISMRLTTSAPAVVVYTANHFNHSGVAAHIGQYDGVALESQVPPQESTDLTPLILMPNEKFNRWIHWQFIY